MNIKVHVYALVVYVFLSVFQVIGWTYIVKKIEEVFVIPPGGRTWSCRLKTMGWILLFVFVMLVCVFYTHELIVSIFPGGVCARRPSGLVEFCRSALSSKEQLCGVDFVIPRATCGAIITFVLLHFFVACFFSE